MRHGALTQDDKINKRPVEVVLVLSTGEARTLVEMVAAAAAERPRKATWQELAAALVQLECW